MLLGGGKQLSNWVCVRDATSWSAAGSGCQIEKLDAKLFCKIYVMVNSHNVYRYLTVQVLKSL